MSISSVSNSSALQVLQSLLNSIETNPTNAADQTSAAGQNLPGADASTGQVSAPPPGPPPQQSSFSDQFSPSALSFLTSLQSSDSNASSGTLNQGLTDLSSALKEIESALTSTSQTQSAGTASLSGVSLTATVSATSASSLSSASLTSSILTTVLNELSQVLDTLGSASAPPSHHHHHHHGGGKGVQASTGASGAATATATATTAATSLDGSTTTTG